MKTYLFLSKHNHYGFLLKAENKDISIDRFLSLWNSRFSEKYKFRLVSCNGESIILDSFESGLLTFNIVEYNTDGGKYFSFYS